MGDAAANAVGMSQAPMTVDDSANGIIRVVRVFRRDIRSSANGGQQIDAATRAESSGKFVDYRGQHIPW
jgi:hypothetical protein